MEGEARYLVGFDGGGTKTECVVCDSTGRVVGMGIAGPSNYHNVGLDGALSALKASFRRATAGSGLTRGLELEACLGLAGLDSPEDLRMVKEGVASTGLFSDPVVVNDWRTALAGAFPDGPGIIVIAGTGCVAAGRDADGRVLRVGGWGSVIDDRGSAYDIGRDALYAAMRDYDSRGPSTTLLARLMRRLRAKEPQGLIERVYLGAMSVTEIAALCEVVAEAASAGDGVSRKILREKGALLGELAVTVGRELGLDAPRIALFGGVFKAGRPLLDPFRKSVKEASPGARFVASRLTPACGGVVLLLQRTGKRIEPDVLRRMAAASPGSSGRKTSRRIQSAF